MKRYSASHARQHLADLLDAAENGEEVVIERRGVRFALSARQNTRRRRAPRRSVIAAVDPAVGAGTWSWEPRRQGLRFAGRSRRS